jgi:hypothetical protein
MALVERIGVAGQRIVGLEHRDRQWSSPSDNSNVRSARSPLTAGSMACMKFTSNAHMTVVTSAPSCRVKKSRKRRTFISNNPGSGRRKSKSQPAP